MVEEGVASPEDIDNAMVLGYKHPVGPLKTTDIVGLDVRLGIAEHLHQTIGDRFAPPQILRDKVAAGALGQKGRRGLLRLGVKPWPVKPQATRSGSQPIAWTECGVIETMTLIWSRPPYQAYGLPV